MSSRVPFEFKVFKGKNTGKEYLGIRYERLSSPPPPKDPTYSYHFFDLPPENPPISVYDYFNKYKHTLREIHDSAEAFADYLGRLGGPASVHVNEYNGIWDGTIIK
jgi:hypothetical protein